MIIKDFFSIQFFIYVSLDFRWLLRTSFLFSFSFMFLVFSCFNFFFFFFDIKRLNFSMYFLKSFLRIFNSLSFCNRPWFSSPMHWFNKNVVFCKQEIYSDNALKSSDALSPVLVPAAKSVNTGEKGELRKTPCNFHFSYFFCFIHFDSHFLNLSQTCPQSIFTHPSKFSIW